MKPPYDALLIVSFGGPEKMDDVIPFLENVLRGKNVPRERLLEVAEHYRHFGGVSPINDQCRALIAALREQLAARGIPLPIYWGNRNWHPLLPDTLRQMASDGIERALAFMTSGYSSYSGCRQYREDVARAQETVGPGAPRVDKLRVFYNHPDFIAVNARNLEAALAQVPEAGRMAARVVFTAHSIPLSMAEKCRYEPQLQETCRLVAEAAGVPADRWALVYQSRSGRPSDPWLEPDVIDHLQAIHGAGCRDAVVLPIGFLSDHMEVLYDLDDEARRACDELGLNMVRAATVGTDPQFVSMICDLIEERLGTRDEKRAVGRFGPSHDVCPADCCLYRVPARPQPT